jgi:hypothetical protein
MPKPTAIASRPGAIGFLLRLSVSAALTIFARYRRALSFRSYFSMMASNEHFES